MSVFMWESTHNASTRKVHFITDEANVIRREPGPCSSTFKVEDCKG